MKQLIIAGKEYSSATNLDEVKDGAIGFYYLKDGAITSMSDGTETKEHFNLVLGRSADKGGNIVLPLHKNMFSYVKGEYQEATKFKATITIPAGNAVGDWSLIIAKKGVSFNERNKWTANCYVKSDKTSAVELAKLLEKQINYNSESSGVKATLEGATLTIEAAKSGVDYSVIPADNLTGVDVNVVTSGLSAYGSADHVMDLAKQCAADIGHEYTYDDGVKEMYPTYGVSPLALPNVEDTGFTIFTLKCAEPRKVRTVDSVINKVVHVAFPTGSAAIEPFEVVCKGLIK